MRFVVLDTTAVNAGDAGKPAQFSAPTIAWLRAQGHAVSIAQKIELPRFHEADAVWTEWANEDAAYSATSGACKRLVVRMRGYECWAMNFAAFPWHNIDALTYESEYLRERSKHIPVSVHQEILPAGLDLTRFPWAVRTGPPVVAMIGRGVELKGYDLMLEWASRRPEIKFYVHISGGDPRVNESVRWMATPNVQLSTGRIDTPVWLESIHATHILSAASYETLGYTIVEGMAMGLKPLVRRRMETDQLWPFSCWRNVAELDDLAHAPTEIASEFDPLHLRKFVEARYDAAKLSPRFAKLLGAL